MKINGDDKKMQDIVELRREDIRKKNLLMFVTFSVAVISTGAYTVLHHDPFGKTLIYIFEYLLFAIFFGLFQITLKKEKIFPYVSIIMIFASNIINVVYYGGSSALFLVIIFLTIISSIHFEKILF